MLRLTALILDAAFSFVACAFSEGRSFPMPFIPHTLSGEGCCLSYTSKKTESDAGQLMSLTLAPNIAPTDSYKNSSSSRSRPKIPFSGSPHSELQHAMVGGRHET